MQPGTSSFVVAGEADFLLGEDDESGGVLDLTERGQVIVQSVLLAVIDFGVGHHVRL